MKNFKILMVFMFILFLSNFTLAREENQIIHLDLQNNSNLTISIEDNYWWFNISGGTLDVDINYTFEVYEEYISNCSEWFDFNFNDCFNKNDNLKSINKRLEKQLAGCGEPTSDNMGNPHCWEKNNLLINKTTDLETCKTGLATKINEKDNLQTSYNTCVTERDDKYNKTNVNMLFVAVVIGGFIIFIWQRKGKTTDQKQVEKKKGGPDMDGVDRKQLAEDMQRGDLE